MFEWLLALDVFTPRTKCGTGWSKTLIWVHQVCEANIALVYFAVASLLAWYIYRRGSRFAYRYVVWTYAAFIAACGLAHILSLCMFHWPVYRLSAVVLVVCAALANSAIVTTYYWSRTASEDFVIPGSASFTERLSQLKQWAEKLECDNAAKQS